MRQEKGAVKRNIGGQKKKTIGNLNMIVEIFNSNEKAKK